MSQAPEIEYTRVVRDGALVREALPRLGYGDVQVRLRAALVGAGALAQAFAPGRAMVVDVMDVGEDAPFKPGQRIYPAWKAACGRCESCASGNETNCKDWHSSRLQPTGIASDFVIPAWNARKASVALGSDLPVNAQVFLEALACHCRALRRAGEVLVRRAVVQGNGVQACLWGLLLEARHLSAQRILCYTGQEALNPRVYGFQEQRAQSDSMLGSDGEGVDLIVITQPDSSWLEWALQRISVGGTVVLSGAASGSLSLDLELLNAREIRLVGSRDSSARDLRVAMELLPQLAGRLEDLIEQVVDFDAWDGYAGRESMQLPIMIVQK